MYLFKTRVLCKKPLTPKIMKSNTVITILILSLFYSCDTSYKQTKASSINSDSLTVKDTIELNSVENDSVYEAWEIMEVPQYTKFSRDNIEKRLAQKIKNKESLIAHVFVPLCDNENQGIVPVGEIWEMD
jgi:hypothetical protein